MEDEMPIFSPFNPETDDPITLVEAILEEGSSLTIDPDSISYSGGFITEPQTSFYDGSLELNIDSGILLTSGDATPPTENTESGYTVNQEGNTDEDLQAVADSAFESAGTVQDANILEFSFTVDDPDVTSVTFDLLFGSDEFPEFSDSSFVDVAAVFVNGENQALFNNDENQPLSIINENLALGNFIDNDSGGLLPENFGGETRTLPIEYDGVSSALTIFAPVNQGENTVKIGVGDTGDQALDSGLFVANFGTSTIGDGGGSGVLIDILGTAEDDELTGTGGNDFIQGFEGNDIVDPGAGNDVIDLGPDNDTLIGGNGDNNADGGEGEDTGSYSGSFAETNVEIIDENTVQVGENTDTLTNFEFLEFDDQTVEIASLQDDSEPEPTPEGVELFAEADDEVLDGSAGDDLLEAVGFSGNTLNGFAGVDELIAGTNGTLNGGEGDDILEATPSGGGNVLNGEAGDDDLFGGNVPDNPDTLNGGDGNDRLFAGLAGNTLSGGAGSDQFWIAQAELPQSSILITDFAQGTDVIGIDGLGDIVATFEDLNIQQTDNTIISVTAEGEEIPLAVLEDFTDSLTADDFALDGVVPEPPELPTVELSVDPTSGSEAEETVFTLTATASEAVSEEQTVDLTLGGDVDADDFAGEIPTAISIAEGETSGSVSLTVNDDTVQEGEETATFTISNPSEGLSLGDVVAVESAIADNDDDPTPAGDEIFRFFNTVTGGHFYTASAEERDFVNNNLPDYEFEGTAFLAAQEDDENATPVFRFYNPAEGEHFYTASEEEKEFVEDNLSQFVSEGTAFFAYEESLSETVPVFRFFDAEGGGHFYTSFTDESNFIQENLPDYDFEGTAFFANPVSEAEVV